MVYDSFYAEFFWGYLIELIECLGGCRFGLRWISFNHSKQMKDIFLSLPATGATIDEDKVRELNLKMLRDI